MCVIMIKKSLKTISYLIFGAVLYTLVFQVFYNWMKFGELLPVPWPEMIRSLITNSIPILILVSANYLIVWKVPQCKRPWAGYCIGLVLSMSVLVIMNMLILNRGIRVEWAGTVFSNFLIFISMEAFYYERVSRMVIRQQALAKQEILQYQYEALKSQVNPHFLFNSFNILYSFLPPELPEAREYVLNLSHIYRYNLNYGNNPQVTLREEMEFLSAYIKILRIRYHDNFDVDIIGAEEYGEKPIIPYTLQMLVENVTKHNAISTVQPMKVTIVADSKGITVSNPVRKKEADVSTHFGLKYLRSLYECHGQMINNTCESGIYTSFIPYLQA